MRGRKYQGDEGGLGGGSVLKLSDDVFRKRLEDPEVSAPSNEISRKRPGEAIHTLNQSIKATVEDHFPELTYRVACKRLQAAKLAVVAFSIIPYYIRFR